MKRLLVTSVDVRAVEDDMAFAQLMHSEPQRAYEPGMVMSDKVTVTREDVPMTVYRNARGEDVHIGLSAAAHEAIGLPLMALENLQANCDSARQDFRVAMRRMANLLNFTLWQRIKAVFCGFPTMAELDEQ